MEKVKTKVKRSLFGQLVKFAFIMFNLIMAYWVVSGAMAASAIEATSEAQQAGQDIGVFVGAAMLIFVWACGSLILGIATFMTRAK